MRRFEYLLLGGGTSCAYAAVKIRENDKEKTVAILGADTEPPYDRPPFSKYFLWNDEKKVDDFHSKDESFYPQNNVELILGKKATAIDRAARKVKLADGEEIVYGKLLYALGSEPRRLPIPGADTAWVLRTAEDSTRIRNAASKGAKAILIGGGYIGAELAASLIGRGCEVTLIERGVRVWPRFPSKDVANEITEELKRKGAQIVTEETIAAVEGGKKVRTESGKTFEGDFVVMGVGASPRIELAKSAGLRIGKEGVSANSGLHTDDQAIWASGDVVEYPDVNLGDNYRAEHHLHAKATAEHCGISMSGGGGDFKVVPFFFSDVGDLSMNLRGFPERAAKSYVTTHTDEPVVTEIFLFADGRIAGIVDLRKDYKAQEPLMELFAELIQKKAVATQIESELKKPGFDPMSLRDAATV